MKEEELLNLRDKVGEDEWECVTKEFHGSFSGRMFIKPEEYVEECSIRDFVINRGYSGEEFEPLACYCLSATIHMDCGDREMTEIVHKNGGLILVALK